MKIILAITKSNWGGAQKYVYDLATNLPEFEVVVLCGGQGKMFEKLRKKNIRIISLPSLERDVNFLKDIKTFFSLLKIFKREKPDIVHLNSSKMGGMGALAGRLVGIKKIIFTAHGWAFNESRNFIARFLIFIFHSFTLVLSHKTIAVSNAIFGEILFKFLQKKMVVVYSGLSQGLLLNKREARQKIAPEIQFDKILWLGSVAELHKNKGLENSIKTMSLLKKELDKFPPFVYIIIGEGEERKQLEKLVFDLGLENFVFLVGEKTSAWKLLTAFDIFIIPSLTESLGYVAMEAGLANLPVIASNTGGLPEIIENMKSGILVKPQQEEELCSAIKFLIEHKERSSEFGKVLKQQVLYKFNIQQMIQKTVSIYNSRKENL